MGRARVTHPFATLCRPEGRLTVRLACVRHAASVHPEPGSNSSFGPSRGRASVRIKEKAIGMMVGPRDRGPLGIGLSKECPSGLPAPRGPSARVPIRLQYPVFKVPGASEAPSCRLPLGPRREDVYYPHPRGESRAIGRFFGRDRVECGRFRMVSWCFSVFEPFVTIHISSIYRLIQDSPHAFRFMRIYRTPQKTKPPPCPEGLGGG